MKKVFLMILVLCLLVGTASACSDKGPAPALETVYDRLVELIEGSHEVNVLLFGVGLPTYPRGDAEDDLVHRYYNVVDDGRDYVTPYTAYVATEDMKTAISAIYGKEYRESLFESLFTGFADSGISGTLPARYSEDEYALYQSTNVEPLVGGVRVYDYATMQIEKGSYDTHIRVSVQSYADDRPGEWTTTYLSFVYEEGDWYLDSPSC